MFGQASRTGRRQRRTGGAAFQLIAFVLVAGLGAWLGARYVGVDVEHIAYTALDETKLIEHIPEDWRPDAPQAEEAEGEAGFVAERRAAELQSELEVLRSEVSVIQQGVNGPAADDQQPAVEGEDGAPSVREATLAYWTRLRQIATEVTELHDGVEPGLEAATASAVFSIRQRAFDYGARAIEAVDDSEVDQQAVDAGHRIAKWYRSGGELYRQASEVWEGRVAGGAGEEAQRSLESARTQHAREAELVRELTGRTEEILMRRYAVQFPVLSI